jgi:replicative DNA helicase
LDAATDGWQNGDLITLVGRPGRGKTFLLLKQAHAAWNAGKSVLFVSMEMTDLQIARRFVGLHTGYNPNFLKLGQLSSDIVPRLHQQVDEMKRGAPFTMVAGNFKKSVESVRGLAEQLCPDIIYVDASYLLSPEKKRQGSSGRRESVSDVVEELASLAKSFNRPVVQTVQFNRNAERSRVRGDDEDSDKNPLSHLSLAKIGETDVIGQTSSVVLGIELGDRPHEATQRYLGILKGREGEQGHWKINYRFSPVDLSIITETEEQTIDVDVMV